MTLSQLYRKAKMDFEAAGIDNPQFDAMCLMKHYFNVDRSSLSIIRNDIPDKKRENDFLENVNKRSSGFPLQYIIGTWSFMDIPILVGEGVLIPRDDTEVLVSNVLKKIEAIPNPKIIDLCSGSGAISIAISKFRPDAEIVALELSEQAFLYLKKNIEINNCRNITAVNGDIFNAFKDFSDYSFDAVISNPPYIKTAIIDTLSPEVKCEPRLALDGGEDGMIFYNIIAKSWLNKIKHGGLIAVEIGEDLSNEILNLFEQNNISEISVYKDMANLDRAILGTVN